VVYLYDLRNLSDPKEQTRFAVSSEACTSISWSKDPTMFDMIMVGTKAKQRPDPHSSPTPSKSTGAAPTKASKTTLKLICIKPTQSVWSLMNDMDFNGCGHFDSVYDVSWALLNGRSFHYVASCGQEGVFVWRLKFKEDTYQVDLIDVKKFKPDPLSVPTCVSWNYSTTLLIVSSSNSVVSIWKRAKDFNWHNISQLQEAAPVRKESLPQNRVSQRDLEVQREGSSSAVKRKSEITGFLLKYN